MVLTIIDHASPRRIDRTVDRAIVHEDFCCAFQETLTLCRF